MDEDEIVTRIHDLEAQVSDLESRLEKVIVFAGAMIGRLARDAGRCPDLGLPTATRFSQEHDIQLAMLLAYNDEAQG